MERSRAATTSEKWGRCARFSALGLRRRHPLPRNCMRQRSKAKKRSREDGGREERAKALRARDTETETDRRAKDELKWQDLSHSQGGKSRSTLTTLSSLSLSLSNSLPNPKLPAGATHISRASNFFG